LISELELCVHDGHLPCVMSFVLQLFDSASGLSGFRKISPKCHKNVILLLYGQGQVISGIDIIVEMG
jgi:hypothetical protein